MIQSKIEDTVSEQMLEGRVAAGKRYACRIADGEFIIEETAQAYE